VAATESFGQIPLQWRIGLFQGEGGSNAVITVGFPAEEVKLDGISASQIEIFGRLESADDPSRAYSVSALHPVAETVPLQQVGDREYRLYLVRGELVPGTYRVSLGVRVGDRAGSFEDRIQVPDFRGEDLKIAGPILAERLDGRSPSEAEPALSVPGVRLLPKLVPVFREGEDFGFYFQVYHAQPEAGDGRVHLELSYTVAIRQNGLFLPLGKPVLLSDSSSSSHAYVFPFKGWAIGEYLLTVTATDRVSENVGTASTFFLIR